MSEFARYNPVWDQSRSGQRIASRSFADDTVVIATDFEGGNGAGIAAIGHHHYEVVLEPEPGEHRFKGIAYYCCFGIRNKTQGAVAIRIRIRAHVHRGETFHDHRHMVVRRGADWSLLPPAAIHPLAESTDVFDLDLTLPPAGATDDVLFVSNFHHWPYSEVVAYMRSLSGVRLREIGASIQGRPILAVEIGREDADAPTILQSATSQASEVMASHACRGGIDFLLSGSAEAQGMLDEFRFGFVPATNPDGSVLGYGVSDAVGGFPHFETLRAAEGSPDASPENIAIWRYVSEMKPWLYWEWHSNNWFRRPGHVLIRFRHELATDPGRRAMWGAIEEKLLALPNTHHEMWTSDNEGVSQDTPGYQASLRLGAISCIIKQHERFGLSESHKHAVNCLRAAVEVYRQA